MSDENYIETDLPKTHKTGESHLSSSEETAVNLLSQIIDLRMHEQNSGKPNSGELPESSPKNNDAQHLPNLSIGLAPSFERESSQIPKQSGSREDSSPSLSDLLNNVKAIPSESSNPSSNRPETSPPSIDNLPGKSPSHEDRRTERDSDDNEILGPGGLWREKAKDKLTIANGTETLRTTSGDQVSVHKDGSYEIKGAVKSIKSNAAGETTVTFADGKEVKFDKNGIRDKYSEMLDKVADKATLDKLANSLSKGEGVESFQKLAAKLQEMGGSEAVTKLMDKLNKRLEESNSKYKLDRLVLHAGLEPWGTVLKDEIRLVKEGQSILDADTIYGLMKRRPYGQDY
ncbi:MAG: hypothetical protein K2X27_25300 [Candidatus Obscuribacterales bacterium]|nr:hypothetical protein [Candidatus Obscuribacterales bacterium]